MLFENIEKYKNNVALFLNHTNKILYKDILNISNKFQKQIKDRSLAILISENCMESLCGYLALLKANNVIMIVDSNIRESDLQDLIKRFRPKYLYCSIKNQKKITKDSFNLIHSLNNL